MYRLLIVDDEELIVHGLSEILSAQTELDLDIYKAYSGREAVEWLDRTRMDIVLTDIRMPEMDGMRLLDEIRRRWPRCRVIFLTGYSEFEYVYRAIQDPDTGYVLKTEDPNRVIEKVEGAIDGIRRETRTEDLLREAKEQVRQAYGFHKQNLFTHILHGRGAATRETLEELGVPLRVELPLLMTLCRAQEAPEGYLEAMRQMQSVRQIVSRAIAPTLAGFVLLCGYDQLMLFAQPASLMGGAEPGDEAAYRKALTFLAGSLEAAQAACRETLGVPVSFAVAAGACAWSDVPAQAARLGQMLACHAGEGIEALLLDDEREERPPDAAAVTPPREGAQELQKTLARKDLTELERLLTDGRDEPFGERIKAYLEPLYSIASKHDPLALEAYYTVALPLLSYINRWGLMEKVAYRLAQYKLTRPDLFDSWGEAADYLRELARVLMALQGEERMRRADRTVTFLQAFIREHLAEDLSLVRLSEQVSLNPSYLSRFYRQTTGVNISDYIESARVERAKKLLADDGARVQDVARQTGYDSTTSFARFFKKNTGRTPQEYRECQNEAPR